MRIGNKGRKPPVRLPESGNRAAEHQTPVDDYGVEDGAPDRPGEVVLNEVFGPEEIVMGAGLPVLGFGLDGPGRGLAVSPAVRPADGGGERVQPGELPQFGSEHAVILREAARI